MKIKIKKNISICLLILGFSCVGYAQQEMMFTQYMFNRLAINPAYAGASGSMCAMVLYRNQWIGFKLDSPTPNQESGKTPVDYLFSFDAPVKALHGGLGFTLFSDQIGYNSMLRADVDYAFRIYWGPGNLAAGIEANIMSAGTDYTQLLGSDDLPGDYNMVVNNSSDPMVGAQEVENEMLIDASTGIYYQVPGTYYFGLSLKNILAAHSDVLNYKNARVLYLTGGYEYVLPSNPSFRLRPSALVRTADFSVFQIDVDCLLEYQNLFWLGAGYRFQDGVQVLAGANWNKMKIGVSYDMTLSKIGGYKAGFSKGTLEAYLRYCFKIIIPPKNPSVYENTRYLL